MGELIQADLSQIGIKVKLITYDWPTYLSKSRTGDHPIIQMGWTGDNGDPDNFLGVLLGCSGIEGGSNLARWCNPTFDKLIQEAKKLTVKSEREKKYKTAQEIFHNEAPWVPIAHATTFRVFSNKIKNYKIDPFGGDVFNSIDLVE
ncbi:MAG: ABC transporter substrate-binding protein [Bacteriovoracaceae bacterium]